MMKRLISQLVPVLLILFGTNIPATVVLPPLFSPSMVVQRNHPIPVWGQAAAGSNLTVKFSDKTAQATADAQGNWKTTLDSLPAGGPYDLTVDGDGSCSVSNVMVGDVWFCSGQSNMDFPVATKYGTGAGVLNAVQEIATADHPRIRFFKQKLVTSPTPSERTDGAWAVCSPSTVTNCSAAAYFFGREIESHENVAVGLIVAAWGGTPIESWTPIDALEKTQAYPQTKARWEAGQASYQKDKADVDQKKAERDRVLAQAKAAGTPPPWLPWIRPPAGSPQYGPGQLFNGLVAPFKTFPIRGVIWYQGEDNAGRANEYGDDLAALITGWRTVWSSPDLPFFFVQLPNYGPRAATPGPSQWATLRDGQAKALSLPNTGMAVTIDVGDAKSIHPSDKQTVGLRLGLAARALVYGESVEGSSPLYVSMTPEGAGIRVHFSHATGGLRASDGQAVTGFEIAGADQKFVPAEAAINGSDVTVQSGAVASPVAVRYAWADNPAANLVSSEGLPVGSFRTDDWPK